MKFIVIIVLTLSVIFAEGVVINEINYNSSDDFNPEDWVEFHNSSAGVVDISNWVFKDEDDDHSFTIPEYTTLASGEFIVLCNDSSAFTSQFPAVTNFVGEIGFGFSGGGELLRLYDSNGTLVDSVNYDDSDPWPEEPDGDGPTLELINPSLDNVLSESWSASSDNGTPGTVNSAYLAIDEPIGVPGAFKVFQNFPNPFNPTTTIQFDIPVGTRHPVSLRIVDINGRLVKTWGKKSLIPGTHKFIWDATNDLGKPVSAGVYLYTIQIGGARQTQKMIFLK